MKISFLPKSKSGKWSLICFAAEVILMVIFYSIIAIFNTKGGDTFFSNPELAIPLILAWLSGAVSFVLGCISLIKGKPKSILVLVVSIVTLLTTVYGILEVTASH